MEIRGFPRQGPRLSIVHGASTASATVVAMARAVVLSVATSVVPTIWQPTEILRQLPRHIPWPPPRQLPRQSTAINGECHGIRRQLPRQSSHGKCHGNTRQLSRRSTAIATAIPRSPSDVNPLQFPRKPTAFRGHPRRLPRQSSNTRQLPRNSTAIATVISTDVNPLQFPLKPRHSAAIRGNCHDNFRTPRLLPRQFHGRLATVNSTENHGIPRRLPRQFPRQLHVSLLYEIVPAIVEMKRTHGARTGDQTSERHTLSCTS